MKVPGKSTSPWLVPAGLLVLALILLGFGLWLSGSGQEPGERTYGERLSPELRGQVNDLDAIDVVGPGETRIATLRRDDERWRVQEREGFEADFAQVRDLLRSLSESRILEPRTAREDWYPRLGVEDIGAEDAGGVVLRFPGTELPGIIVGQSSPALGGHYVRREGEDQSWLIDRSLDVKNETIEWLERSVMDIPSEEIQKVVIRHPDGATIQVRATGLDDPAFVLTPIPEGQVLQAGYLLDDLASGLARMRLDDVRRHDGLPDEVTRALYTTIDGLNFVASLFSDDRGNWVHFRVSAETPATGAADSLDVDDSDRLVGAVAVDARLSPWEFGISDRKFRQMTRRLEDLLEPERVKPPDPPVPES